MALKWDRDIVEKGYVLSLVRRSGEDEEDCLDRWHSVTTHITEGDFAKSRVAGKYTKHVFKVLLKAYRSGRAMSIKLLAQQIGADEQALRKEWEEIDSDYILVYASRLKELSERSLVMHALRTAEGATSSALLDDATRRLANIRLDSESDRVKPLEQSEQGGYEGFLRDQADLKSGKIRFAFPKRVGTLNEHVPYVFPGHTVLLTAKTKVGKSSMAGQIYDWNLERGLRGIYFRFEDSDKMDWYKRIGRRMAGVIIDRQRLGVPVRDMLSTVLPPAKHEVVEWVRKHDISKWQHNGIQVFCPMWTMERVIAVWERYALQGKVDFVVIDYLNKAWLSHTKLKEMGLFAARGLDAELVKSTAEKLGSVAVMVQQEGDNGLPYETRQGSMKFQAWISLQRPMSEDGKRMLEVGKDVGIQVRNANMGSTGFTEAVFYKDWMLWAEPGEL